MVERKEGIQAYGDLVGAGMDGCGVNPPTAPVLKEGN